MTNAHSLSHLRKSFPRFAIRIAFPAVVAATGLLVCGASGPLRSAEPSDPAAGGEAPLVSGGHTNLQLAGAETILAAAKAKAQSMGVKANIAVVDDGGRLLAFIRLDGARPGSVYTAMHKAEAAALMRMPTGPAGADVLHNLSLQNAANHGGGRFTSLHGGVPISIGGEIVGAVGVGGGVGEQDAEIAKAGIEALLESLKKEPAKTSSIELPK